MATQSDQFARALAAALRLSTVEKLYLIAGLAGSVAEEIQSHRAWQLTLDGVITETHQLVVQFPHDFPPCKVKVVIAWPDGMELNKVTIDQLKVTVQLPDTEAIRQWFSAQYR